MKSENCVRLESPKVALSVLKETGAWSLLDKRTGVVWSSNPQATRLGEVTLRTKSGETQNLPLIPDFVCQEENSVRLMFHPDCGDTGLTLMAKLTLMPDGETIDVSYTTTGSSEIEEVKLLDNALSIMDSDSGYLLIPVRLGLLIPSDSGVEFSHRFGTFDYEGCHIEMLGLVKQSSALLVTWHDPYITAEVKSKVDDKKQSFCPFRQELSEWVSKRTRQSLSISLHLRKTAHAFQLRPLGVGDLNTIAQAYRDVAKEKGWLVTWDEKLKEHPQAENLFGAINFKLWTALARRIDENLQEQSVTVCWTFDEVAQIAEHLKNDLKLDRVLFILGGWIHRGYDCEHPDILPAAPECGGDEGLIDCSRRVRALGYPFSLHDNYQDMYRDAPSWDEDYIMKNPDGSPRKGGLWLGGRAFLTCSKKAVELAKRPQNLPKVKELFEPDIYFIDTTYAAGLCECFDPNHPLTKWDDMFWKSAISDYAREVFGLFGSECGREWAMPHSDWFEGLTGVSGRYYHSLDPEKFGGTVVPLFEMIYRDSIVMHGKYGYRFDEAAEYVLHHVSIGRTLNYHSIGHHLYWHNDTQNEVPFPAEGMDKACFTRAHNGWAEGLCLTDRFIKNTYEILSPLNELTSNVRLTQVDFLTPDRKVRRTRFGEAATVTVNGSSSNFTISSKIGGEVILPPFGFVVESPTFVVFHAYKWGGVKYDSPVLFTLRSLDGKPISESEQVRVFHGFGDARLAWRDGVVEVGKEIIIE
ncbi:hypothetical protein FJZ31_38500 [Candidatus Poribacteria bacterium]|nr:hypothetical protein [Candidatus Poribacteria bacterium]